jgi:hypothetical protein
VYAAGAATWTDEANWAARKEAEWATKGAWEKFDPCDLLERLIAA